LAVDCEPIANVGGPFDCDDTSAQIHPGAVDTWGDGIDSDCLNGDAPACTVLWAGGRFEVQPPEAVTCANPDL
jgi:hypothetical protein